MDILIGVGWANYSDQEKNDLYNIFAITPIDNFWFIINDIHQKKHLMLEYVNAYNDRVRRHNVEKLGFLIKNEKFKKILIGCMVNISALGATTSENFDFKKILGESKRFLVTNRQRNAASHICIRTNPPITFFPDKIIDFIRSKDKIITKYSSDTNNNNQNPFVIQQNTQKGRVGDRTTTKTLKIYYISSKMLGMDHHDHNDHNESNFHDTMHQKTIQSASKNQIETNSLLNLFSCFNKPYDLTKLVYPSGSMVLTGAKHPYMALYSLCILMWQFSCEGIATTHLKNFSIQNIVSTFRMPVSFDLLRLEKKWTGSNIRYSQIRFPAAIYNIEKGVTDIIIQRANIRKAIRNEIINDSRFIDEDMIVPTQKMLSLTRSYNTSRIQKSIQDKNKPKIDLLSNEKKDHPSSSKNNINEIEEEIIKTIEKDLSDGSGMKLKIRPDKLVALIYTTGAVILTGPHDEDIQIAAYEVIYDLLMDFKRRCNIEDEKIADDEIEPNLLLTHSVDKPSSISELIPFSSSSISSSSSSSSEKQNMVLGVSQKGSVMQKISAMVQLQHMADVAKKRKTSELRKQNFVPIAHQSPSFSSSSSVEIKTEPIQQSLIPIQTLQHQEGLMHHSISDVYSPSSNQKGSNSLFNNFIESHISNKRFKND